MAGPTARIARPFLVGFPRLNARAESQSEESGPTILAFAFFQPPEQFLAREGGGGVWRGDGANAKSPSGSRNALARRGGLLRLGDRIRLTTSAGDPRKRF
jgi:hypothetical protein